MERELTAQPGNEERIGDLDPDRSNALRNLVDYDKLRLQIRIDNATESRDKKYEIQNSAQRRNPFASVVLKIYHVYRYGDLRTTEEQKIIDANLAEAKGLDTMLRDLRLGVNEPARVYLQGLVERNTVVPTVLSVGQDSVGRRLARETVFSNLVTAYIANYVLEGIDLANAIANRNLIQQAIESSPRLDNFLIKTLPSELADYLEEAKKESLDRR